MVVARVAFVIVLVVSRLASGEGLAVKRYTTEDGLASDQVLAVMRDSSGFMWVATVEGVSRFDGYGFTNYGIDKGVPGPASRTMIQTRDGTIWVGTRDGVARLAPGASRFEVLHFTSTNDVVYALFEDHEGRLWAGTETGLYLVDRHDAIVAARRIELSLSPPGYDPSVLVLAIVEDRDHALWLGTNVGLVRRTETATKSTIERYDVTDVPGADDRVFRLLFDRQGRLWVGHVNSGLFVFRPPPPGTRLLADTDNLIAAAARQGPPLAADGRVRFPVTVGEIRHLTTAEGLAGNWVRPGLFESEDGTIWLSSLGLSSISDGRIRAFTAAQGMLDSTISPTAEDSAGNLWLATGSSGVMRLARGGMVTFDERDGLVGTKIMSVVENGELYVVGRSGDSVAVYRLDGNHFVGVVPKVPDPPGWGWGQITFRDRDDRWWVAGGGGLARFPKVDRIEDLATATPTFYQDSDGLVGRDVFRMYGDRHGDVWISSYSPTTLERWIHETGKFLHYTVRDGLPASIAMAFAEDSRGCLFIGFEDGQLARSCGGGFERFGTDDAVLRGMIQSLYFDHAGRLWIATALGGVGRIDDPRAARPSIRSYGVTQGLSTNRVNAITEDLHGAIYLGTSHGVDRLDPDSGRVHHYGVAEGLASSVVQIAMRDHTGALWFGTWQGLSRLTSSPDHPAPMRILIVGVRVGGVAYPVSSQGQTSVDGLELEPDQNQLEISFVGLSAAIGQPLRYQIRLDGVDSEWSAPITERSIRYAGLEAGSYRFQVRAISSEGASPAVTVSFEVYAPIWKRPWFMALAAGLVVLAGFAIHRRRLARRLELERVRLRIATDLHDDVGSSLSRIAILSDVVSREVDAGRPVKERLGEISQTARDLVDTAGDIVWSIDPRRDDLDSLIARFRRFVGDLFDGRGIEWTLAAPVDAARLKLSADQRRHLFLILKEAVHNVVRHAACRTVIITITHADREVVAEVSDDGRGFVPSPSSRGGGLANMRARVAASEGKLDVESAPGKGTRLRIRIPIAR